MTIRQLRELLDDVPEFMRHHPVYIAVAGLVWPVGGMGLAPPDPSGEGLPGVILFDEVASLPGPWPSGEAPPDPAPPG